MSLLDVLVNVAITVGGKVPTVQGFGTPLYLAYHTNYSDLLRAYTDPSGLLTDGFTVNSPAYRWATKVFSQTPHPPQFFIGRRQTAFTQIVSLTLCNTGALAYPYSFTVVDDLGQSFVVPGIPSTGVPATDATAIFTTLTVKPVTYDHTTSHAWTVAAGFPFLRAGQAVQLGGTPPTGYSLATSYYMINVTATTFQLSATKGGSVVVATTDNGTTVTLDTVIDNCVVTNPGAGVLTFTCAAGHMIDITGLPVPMKNGALGTITVQTTTTDPGIVADLAAIEAIDATSWYGVSVDSNSKAEILALAPHIEAERKILCFSNSDSDQVDNTISTDLLSMLKASGYTRTLPLYDENEVESYGGGGAWMGGMLATQPGAGNWAYRTLVGVAVSGNLGGLANTITSIPLGSTSKNGNVYVNVAGVGVTLSGLTPAGTFIDVPIFLDWLAVNIQARAFIRMINASAAGKKVPYTDAGMAQFGQDVEAQLAAGSDPNGPNPGIVPGSWKVTVPPVSSANPVDKANRVAPIISFSGQLTGALNNLKFTGSLTV